MTDEELGRAWASANKNRPHKTDDGFYNWFPTRADIGLKDGPHNLSAELTAAVRTFKTAAEAFTALGRAIRATWAFADTSRSQVGVGV